MNCTCDKLDAAYVPVTERGVVVHAARQARAAFQEMRVSAGLAALRTAAGKGARGAPSEDIKDRLA